MPRATMPGRALDGQQLTIDLVPRTCWFTNVRSHVSSKEWDLCKAWAKEQAGGRCAICGGTGTRWPVECHEVWSYVERSGIVVTDIGPAGREEGVTYARTQRLDRLIALCPACHEVKHIGHAELRGRLMPALEHLARVNGWTMDDAALYANTAFEEWCQRSTVEWELDVSWLATIGVRVPDTTNRHDSQIPEGEWEPA